jgi:ATP-dependent Zn protease
MKQVFYRYELWEDYQNGMFHTKKEDTEIRQEQSKFLLTDLEKFYEIAKKVVDEWKISTLVNFTNPQTNKQAWLGQASCCYYCGSSEEETKKAWNTMTEEEQKNANDVADKVFEEWRVIYESKNNVR